MKHLLLTTIAAVVLLGCDPHVDSVYLGRAEANMLNTVSAGDIEAIKKYLDNGGNVNLQDEPGMTPLHHAVNSDWKGKNFEMVKLLIDRGANVKAIDDTHHTPLHLASNKETAELLIDAGADVNAKTQRTGETLLYSAAWGAAQGHPKSYQIYLDLTKMLIAKGAEVNAKDKRSSTPLDAASTRSHSEIADLLRKHGSKTGED